MVKKLKTKRDRMELEGTIIEAHRGCMFDVSINDNESKILASISGKMRKAFIKVVPGDRVTVEVSPYDMSKGRIIKRLR